MLVTDANIHYYRDINIDALIPIDLKALLISPYRNQ